MKKKTNDLIKLLNKIDFMGNGKKLEPVLQKFNISKAYALVKIHKVGFPVRPIISTVIHQLISCQNSLQNSCKKI